VKHRRVEVRYEEGERPWRIYWSGTQQLADERRFATLEEAGPVARALVGEMEPGDRGDVAFMAAGLRRYGRRFPEMLAGHRRVDR